MNESETPHTPALYDTKVMGLLISQYAYAKQHVDQAQAEADELLEEIVRRGKLPESGTTIIVGEGYSFKITTKLNHTIDREAYMRLDESHDLSEDDEECVTWKPSLAAGKYKRLPLSSALHQCVTSKPAKAAIKEIQIISLPEERSGE